MKAFVSVRIGQLVKQVYMLPRSDWLQFFSVSKINNSLTLGLSRGFTSLQLKSSMGGFLAEK